MLMLAAASLLLLAAATVVGLGVLHVADPRARLGLADRAIVAGWVGLITLGAALLAVALVVPLGTPVALCAYVAAPIALLARTAVREDAGRVLMQLRRPRWGISATLLLVALALLGADSPGHYDTGLYQFQLVEWLSRYGVVRGLALLHVRLGFQSVWFALESPLNAGALWGRVSQVGLVAPLFLACSQLVVCARRLVLPSPRVADAFVVCALGPRLLLGLIGGRLTPELYTTGSPEMPVALLVIVLAWLLVSLEDTVREDRAERSLLPLLLGVGAAAIKLNGLPAALVGWAYHVIAGPPSRRFARAARASVLGAAMLSPVVAASLRTSGCAVYPLGASCVGGPHGLPRSEVRALSTYITEFARTDASRERPASSPWAWITPWSTRHPLLVALITATALLCGAWGLLARRQPARGAQWVALLALLGIVIIGWSGPSDRFLLSYALLIPAVVAARGLRGLLARGQRLLARAQMTALASWAVFTGLVAIAFGSAGNSLRIGAVLRPHERVLTPDFRAHLVWPARVPVPTPLYRTSRDGLTYYSPAPPPVGGEGSFRAYSGSVHVDQCWGAPLPCTPYLALSRVRPSDAKSGLAAGFARGPE